MDFSNGTSDTNGALEFLLQFGGVDSVQKKG